MATIEFKMLGAGYFSQVFEIKHSKERRLGKTVVKIGGNFGPIAEDGWWTFAEWVMKATSKKNCPGRKHLPVIKYADRETGIAIMGRLKNDLNGLDNDECLMLLRKYFPGIRSDCHIGETMQQLIYNIGEYFRGAKAIYSPRGTKSTSKEWKNFCFFAKWFRKNAGFRMSDIHGGNIMVDDEFNLVITDPTSWE